MNSADATVAVIHAFESSGLPYMVVGSISSNVYGVERSTRDADFVVQLDSHGIGRLVSLLGPDFRLDPQMGFETVTATTKYILRQKNNPFIIEVFELGDDPHDRERFARRRRVNLGDVATWAPAPEDVIITKLRWSKQGRRAKDIEDVKGVLIVQTHEALDWKYLQHWCGQHGTWELLQKLRAETASMN